MKLPLKLIKGTKDRLSTIKGGKYSFELKGYGYDLESELKAAEFIVKACNNYQLVLDLNKENLADIGHLQTENSNLKSENAKLQESNNAMAELLTETHKNFIIERNKYAKTMHGWHQNQYKANQIEQALTAAGHKV